MEVGTLLGQRPSHDGVGDRDDVGAADVDAVHPGGEQMVREPRLPDGVVACVGWRERDDIREPSGQVLSGWPSEGWGYNPFSVPPRSCRIPGNALQTYSSKCQ